MGTAALQCFTNLDIVPTADPISAGIFGQGNTAGEAVGGNCRAGLYRHEYPLDVRSLRSMISDTCKDCRYGSASRRPQLSQSIEHSLNNVLFQLTDWTFTWAVVHFGSCAFTQIQKVNIIFSLEQYVFFCKKYALKNILQVEWSGNFKNISFETNSTMLNM